MADSLKKKSVKGTIWNIIDNLATQFLGFLIGMVLARLLSPSDYGTIGVLSIFLAIANVFVDCGFATGLIRKQNRTESDLATAFYFNAIVGIICYIILFAISPLVASFFKMPILTILLRVMAFCMLFNSLGLVQNAILTANLKMKTIARINIGSQTIMGCVGIYFAYKGFGLWTLVIQQVGGSIIRCLALWIVGGWKPKTKWNKESFNYLFNYGWKLLGANLIGTIFNQIHGFFIGRNLGASDLGFFSKARDLCDRPSGILLSVINKVMLPILACVGNDKNEIKQAYAKMNRMCSFVTFAAFTLLIVIAKPLIVIIWTEKWVNTVILLQILCVSACFGPVSQMGLTVMQLMNRTDLTLKFEFIKKPMTLILLLIALPFGLKIITISMVVASLYCTVVNMYATKKLLSYGYREQFTDMLPYILMAIVSGSVSYFVGSFFINNWANIIISSLSYGLLYISLSFVFKAKGFYDIINLRK